MKTYKFNEKALDKATASNNAKVKTVKGEVAFQQKLNRYALANSKKDFSTKKVVERVTNLFKRFNTLLTAIRDAKVKPVANWSYIGQFFTEHVGHLSENDFTQEAKDRIERDMAGSKLEVELTKEQENTIVEFHMNWAKGNWEQIQTVREILLAVGVIEGKSIIPARELPSKAEREELQKQAAG